jgi:acyl-CoA synthetase (AMP-forming)/AMP-acid ligase II
MPAHSRTPTAAVLAWLDDPRSDRGVRVAGREDWTFWSWAELAVRSRGVAAGLAETGVRPGDIVAMIEPDGASFVASLFGALLAGATPAPVAPPPLFQDRRRYDAHLLSVLRTLRPALLMTGSKLAGELAPVAAAAGVRALAAASVAGDPEAWSRAPAPELALVQLTSGTTGSARPVPVALRALDANIDAIRAWLRMTGADATASWLPLHHDMGLVGCLLAPAANASDLWLLTPEQFLRSPLAYLRCFQPGGATLSTMPGFGLEHVLGRLPPEALDGLDLSHWRALVVGAERLRPDVFARFERLLAPAGFDRRALLAGYGLAEATLAVTGLPLGRGWRAAAAPASHAGDRVVGCGSALAGIDVTIEGPAGTTLHDGEVGEIVVAGASVATASGDNGSETGAPPGDGRLRTGDAGFLRDGELFVLGRLGDGLKVRGRYVFPEDIEADLVASGIPSRRAAVLLGCHDGAATAVAVLERPDDGWAATARRALRRGSEAERLVVIRAPAGTIEWTTSGKPKRRALWTAFVERRLPTDLDIEANGNQRRGIRV